jgi:PadR family transcriptional regulator, regulatory protein AphA
MSLRHAMLGLLANGPASGYDLLKVFELSLANVWPATQSQVYAELNRLADAGLVEVSAEGPRGRKEYGITDDGLAELRRWLTSADPRRAVRSETLLRVFFLDKVEPEAAKDYLERRASEAAKEHDDLRAMRETLGEGGDGPLTAYGLLALEWGLRFTAMQREWAQWAVEQLKAINGHDA